MIYGFLRIGLVLIPLTILIPIPISYTMQWISNTLLTFTIKLLNYLPKIDS